MEKRIEINNLCFSYNEKVVLKECFANFCSGKCYVILGNNGVGKTTLFRCLIKQNKINDNCVFIDGIDINQIGYNQYSKIVSYVGQLNSLENSDILVRDYLVQGRSPYVKTFGTPTLNDYEIMYEYAKQVGIDHLLGRSLNELSGGELQMINITRAIIQETPIMILDEPLSALDLHNQIKVLALIKKISSDNKIVIFSSHNPNHALTINADVVLMKNGKILSMGNYQQNISSATLKELYDCEIDVDKNGNIILPILK